MSFPIIILIFYCYPEVDKVQSVFPYLLTFSSTSKSTLFLLRRKAFLRAALRDFFSGAGAVVWNIFIDIIIIIQYHYFTTTMPFHSSSMLYHGDTASPQNPLLLIVMSIATTIFATHFYHFVFGKLPSFALQTPAPTTSHLCGHLPSVSNSRSHPIEDRSQTKERKKGRRKGAECYEQSLLIFYALSTALAVDTVGSNRRAFLEKIDKDLVHSAFRHMHITRLQYTVG